MTDIRPLVIGPNQSKAYLNLIRQMPCVICIAMRVTHPFKSNAHHPRGLKFGTGTGVKASDYLAFPLCRIHHGPTIIPGGSPVAYHDATSRWPWDQEECIRFTWAYLQYRRRIPERIDVGRPCRVNRSIFPSERPLPITLESFLPILELFPGLTPKFP